MTSMFKMFILIISVMFITAPIAIAEHCTEPTKIIMIRHGQTDWNVLGILQGNANIPLNLVGYSQADQLKNDTHNKHIDHIYSSPLDRAISTAQPMADDHGIEHIKIRYFLREIGLGQYTGYTYSQIPYEIKSNWTTNAYYSMPSGIPNTTGLIDPSYVENIYFQGESLNHVQDRVWDGLEDMVEDNCGENVVTVTHGGVIQVTLTKVYNQPATNYSKFSIPTVSQTVIQFNPNGSVQVIPDW